MQNDDNYERKKEFLSVVKSAVGHNFILGDTNIFIYTNEYRVGTFDITLQKELLYGT